MTPDPHALLGSIGERALVEHLRRRVPASEGVVVGIGDDGAVVQIAPLAIVTTDVLVEGVHFTRDAVPARLLGRKALSVNLSDVAAMGGVARYATVSLCLPARLELQWVDGLYDGLLERAAEAGVAIVGGNVSRSPETTVVDVALIGDAAARPLLRSGARPGDRIVVTGALGGAAEGVRLLGEGARLAEDGQLAASGIWTASSASALVACLRAQLDPRPPLALARAVCEQGLAHAGMDLSDGLAGDLALMCAASGAGAVVDAAALPVEPGTASLERARGGNALEVALHGGEDYQLLLAVDPARVGELHALAAVWSVVVSVVGEFTADEGRLLLREASGERALEPRGHDHFAAAKP